jgi:hypothetical protein
MKAVPIYLALVGLPIAIMIPVLKVGRTLSAPPAVAGEWQAAGPALGVRVQQSGRYVELVLVDSSGGRLEFVGTMRGAILEATAEDATALPCADSGSAALRLTFAEGVRPQSAQGETSGFGAGCGIPLRLTRMPATARAGSAH